MSDWNGEYWVIQWRKAHESLVEAGPGFVVHSKREALEAAMNDPKFNFPEWVCEIDRLTPSDCERTIRL